MYDYTMYKTIIFTVVFVSVCWKHISSLQAIPERAQMAYVNEKYFYKFTINVRRYARRSPYYINIELVTKMEFGNNVSLNIIFYEFLHNEYKRSFVEMKLNKICEVLNKDPYVGKGFKQIGLVCPMPAGVHKMMMNLTVPLQDFPNVWPFEKGKAEVNIFQNQNGEVMAIAEIYAIFKQKPRGK